MYPAAFAVKLVCTQPFQADGRAAMAPNAHLRDMQECAKFPAAALAPQPEQPSGAGHRFRLFFFLMDKSFLLVSPHPALFR